MRSCLQTGPPETSTTLRWLPRIMCITFGVKKPMQHSIAAWLAARSEGSRLLGQGRVYEKVPCRFQVQRFNINGWMFDWSRSRHVGSIWYFWILVLHVLRNFEQNLLDWNVDLVVFPSLVQQIGHLSVRYVLGYLSPAYFLKEPFAQCAGQTVDSNMWKLNEVKIEDRRPWACFSSGAGKSLGRTIGPSG